MLVTYLRLAGVRSVVSLRVNLLGKIQISVNFQGIKPGCMASISAQTYIGSDPLGSSEI